MVCRVFLSELSSSRILGGLVIYSLAVVRSPCLFKLPGRPSEVRAFFSKHPSPSPTNNHCHHKIVLVIKAGCGSIFLDGEEQ